MVTKKLAEKNKQKKTDEQDEETFQNQNQRRSQISTNDDEAEIRLRVRLDYRQLIDDLNTNRQLYTSPDNDALEKKIDQVDQAFAKVKMPREGVLDATTLRTISNLASVRIRAVDETGSLDRAYDFARKSEKIISKLVGNANEFYELFAHFHYNVPSPSLMNGRLPTKLFTNEYAEKQKQRAKPVRQPKLTQEELEKSRTKPEEVKEFKSELGEQTIKQIMHIKRCLVDRYKDADCSPIDYFEFVIDPKSFSKTVENMFHVSFLIKEGFVNLFQDDVSLPALEPTAKAMNRTGATQTGNQNEEAVERSNQMIMSITMDEWEQLIEVYNITEAQITPKN